jgi:ABC-type sugar transport system substrate-binding protein
MTDKSVLEIDVGDGLSRRKVMRRIGGAAALGAFGGLAGCSGNQGNSGGNQGNNGSQDSSGGGQGSGGAAPDYQLVEYIPPPTNLDYTSPGAELDMVMVTHDASASFFVPVIAGLHDAARQVGWNARFTGPSSGFDPEKQVDIVNSTIDEGPDVLATTIVNKQTFTDAIKRAVDNDIHVITYNTNAWSRDEMRNRVGQALAFAGQIQIPAGYATGVAVLDAMDDTSSGSAAIGISDPGHSALSARAEGVEMAFSQNSNLNIKSRINYGGNSSDGISAVEDFITANPDVKTIVGVDGFAWFVGRAIENQGKSGEIIGGGIDVIERILEEMKKGNLQVAVGQDGYSQGYVPTTSSWAYMTRGIPPKNYITGAEVVTPQNVDQVLTRSNNWSTLREWQQSQ